MRHENNAVPPLFQVADPNVDRVDVERLTGQTAQIYRMLREGPKTNAQLAAVTARYGARLYDLRKAGVSVVTAPARDGSGLVVYLLDTGGAGR